MTGLTRIYNEIPNEVMNLLIKDMNWNRKVLHEKTRLVK